MTQVQRKESAAVYGESVSLTLGQVQGLLAGAGGRDLDDLLRVGNMLALAASMLREISVRKEG